MGSHAFAVQAGSLFVADPSQPGAIAAVGEGRASEVLAEKAELVRQRGRVRWYSKAKG